MEKILFGDLSLYFSLIVYVSDIPVVNYAVCQSNLWISFAISFFYTLFCYEDSSKNLRRKSSFFFFLGWVGNPFDPAVGKWFPANTGRKNCSFYGDLENWLILMCLIHIFIRFQQANPVESKLVDAIYSG